MIHLLQLTSHQVTITEAQRFKHVLEQFMSALEHCAQIQ